MKFEENSRICSIDCPLLTRHPKYKFRLSVAQRNLVWPKLVTSVGEMSNTSSMSSASQSSLLGQFSSVAFLNGRHQQSESAGGSMVKMQRQNRTTTTAPRIGRRIQKREGRRLRGNASRRGDSRYCVCVCVKTEIKCQVYS